MDAGRDMLQCIDVESGVFGKTQSSQCFSTKSFILPFTGHLPRHIGLDQGLWGP